MLLRRLQITYINVKEKMANLVKNLRPSQKKKNFTLCFEFAFAKVQTCSMLFNHCFSSQQSVFQALDLSIVSAGEYTMP